VENLGIESGEEMPKPLRDAETRAIGARIREERTRAGLRLSEFAALLGISTKQTTRIEQGYRVSNVRLAHVAKVLGLSYDYVLTGRGPRVAPEFQSPQVGPFESEFEQMLRRVVAEELRRFFGTARPPAGPRTSGSHRSEGSRRRRGSG
jgi:transcriptional regulator with XRE-family HTH domain